MELPEQIETWTSFFELHDNYKVELYNQARKGELLVQIKYPDLARHSPDLAELLVDMPLEILKGAEKAIEKMDIPRTDYDENRFHVSISDLPTSNILKLKQIRSGHFDKLCQSKAEVVHCEKSKSRVISCSFECPSCGNIIPLLQMDIHLREPTRCGCGRKGKFKLLSKDKTDALVLLVKQPLSEQIGTASYSENERCLLLGELASPKVKEQLRMGQDVIMTYVPSEQPEYFLGKPTVTFDRILKVNHIEPMKDDTIDVSFSEKEIEEFKEMTQRKNFFEDLCETLYCSHEGDPEIKIVCTAQLFAGSFTEDRKKELFHILLGGDTGANKTSGFLQPSCEYAPISEIVYATTASNVGLLGSAGATDPLTNRRLFEPGIILKKHRGLVSIDEANCLGGEDNKALNEVLADQTLTIHKANINGTFPADVRVLSACNPKKELDEYTLASGSMFGIEYSTLNRYHFVFVMRDVPSEEKDRAILARKKKMSRPLDPEKVKRLILYARNKVVPVLSDEDESRINDFIVLMRKNNDVKINITHRQGDAMKALARCIAKAHLREKTCLSDVEKAARVVERMFKDFGGDMNNLTRFSS